MQRKPRLVRGFCCIPIITKGTAMRHDFPPTADDELIENVNEHISLLQKKDGIRFGTDAYLLSAFVRPIPRGILADLGSGSGIVSLLCLAGGKIEHAHAVELQEEYCALIRRNAERNGLGARISVVQTDVRKLGVRAIGEHPTVVVSNPPYLRCGAGLRHSSQRMETARREENGTVDDFCAAGSRLLQSRDSFYVVYRPDRLADLLCALRAGRLEPKRMVTVYPDPSSAPCLILVEAVKDASPSLLYAPPLCIYRSAAERVYTDAMQRIYDGFSMEFLFSAGKETKI